MVEVRLSEQDKKRFKMAGATEKELIGIRRACEHAAEWKYNELYNALADGLEPSMQDYLKENF